MELKEKLIMTIFPKSVYVVLFRKNGQVKIVRKTYKDDTIEIGDEKYVFNKDYLYYDGFKPYIVYFEGNPNPVKFRLEGDKFKPEIDSKTFKQIINTKIVRDLVDTSLAGELLTIAIYANLGVGIIIMLKLFGVI